MIKEIKTEKFEGLAVLVPDGAYDYRIMYHNLFGYRLPGEGNRCFTLPVGNDYQIIGKATELTEEQCQRIMPLPAISAKYGDPYQYCPAKDSFNTLLYELGCYVLGENNKPPAGTWLILQKL